jgi:AcrR family transcriptional regulator
MRNGDQRTRRTRDAILRALTRLVFERRYDAIKTGDLIAAAGVGRSTFYEHFRSKDEVLVAAMEPILLPLANAAAGRASNAYVRSALDHLWEQRAFARVILSSAVRTRIERGLAQLIEAKLDEGPTGAAPRAMIARAVAAAQLTMLTMWVGGEVACPVEGFTRQTMACSTFARSSGA